LTFFPQNALITYFIFFKKKIQKKKKKKKKKKNVGVVHPSIFLFFFKKIKNINKICDGGILGKKGQSGRIATI
jgi:hypothetical protein